jgi:hypothetical protein
MIRLVLFLLCFSALNICAEERGLDFVSKEEYETYPKVEKYRAFLPRAVDISSKMPDVGSQGLYASCTGWSLSYAIRSYFTTLTAEQPIKLSPRFLYDHIVPNGDCKKGVSIPKALNFLKDVGTVPYGDYAGVEASCAPSNKTNQLANRAKNFRISGWDSIPPYDLDRVKGSLYRGFPVEVGMMLGDDFENYRGGIFKTYETHGLSGHAMAIIGYDDNKGAFKVMNSWGTGWGENGFGWISYDVFKLQAAEFYVMYVNKTKTLPPNPKPIIEPKPSPSPLPKPRISKENIEDFVKKIIAPDCTFVDVSVNGNNVRLKGVLKTEKDKANLVRAIEAEYKDIKLQEALEVKTWPSCELYITVNDLANKSNLNDLVLNSKKPSYRNNEELDVNVSVGNAKGFLNIYYLQANGTAVQIVNDLPVTKNFKSTLGEIRKDYVLKISPPFGSEAIVGFIASKQNLSNFSSKALEDREFLTKLRVNLNQMANKKELVEISTTYINTEK